MTVSNFILISVAIVLIFSGCATSSTKTRVFQDMAIGAALGSLVGQSKDSNRQANTQMYAAIGATMGAIYSVAKNLDDSLKTENSELKAKLDKFQKQIQPQLTQSGASLFSAALPKEVAGLVEPGEWKRYKMDQWIQDPNQPNTWYRQVEMFEIIPPSAK